MLGMNTGTSEDVEASLLLSFRLACSAKDIIYMIRGIYGCPFIRNLLHWL